MPWLSGPMQPRIFGDYAAIRRDYGIEEYIADATPHGVVKSVYIQVNVAAGDEVEEVAWVQQTGSEHGFPHAIVGYVDLRAPDALATLDRERAHPRLRACGSSSTGTRIPATGSLHGPTSWASLSFVLVSAPSARAGSSSSFRCLRAR